MCSLLPDGRTLAQALKEFDAASGRVTHPRKGRKTKGRGGMRWEGGENASRKTENVSWGQSWLEDEEQELMHAANLGSRRRQRWLNDRMLLALSGPLDADSMARLFSPAPFGEEPRPSPFADMANVLSGRQPLEAVVNRYATPREEAEAAARRRARRAATAAATAETPATTNNDAEAEGFVLVEEDPTAAEAERAWRAVGSRMRSALKDAHTRSAGLLEELEERLEPLLLAEAEAEAEVVLGGQSGWERLLTHGVAAVAPPELHKHRQSGGARHDCAQAGRRRSDGAEAQARGIPRPTQPRRTQPPQLSVNNQSNDSESFYLLYHQKSLALLYVFLYAPVGAPAADAAAAFQPALAFAPTSNAAIAFGSIVSIWCSASATLLRSSLNCSVVTSNVCTAPSESVTRMRMLGLSTRFTADVDSVTSIRWRTSDRCGGAISRYSPALLLSRSLLPPPNLFARFYPSTSSSLTPT
eukprot:CAMPEP_0170135486 /NCGR_PEP_ID=MMETSP0033_2-20121228/2503_1 /TAXON_ID=195969 /ORGANISM="Dolichomastix tenuilepis, Strain CCMP3274" /LENGTH=470 /DNA_ID=CAMNT_0010371087 /DNA_START=33 /DNA_END=1441 /DNA_ORIENTATION=-